ncbi:hypothetical protein [Echinicola sp. 20G]|uniref:hypothetical protein n=1 Tax=Echinicola sp. 20G TaxID=2781961 RepID=UPI001910BAFA|nr:hypothetical protein [Echinicola sp. 20G]
METKANQLYQVLNENLQSLKSNGCHPLVLAEKSIALCIKSMEELREFLTCYIFKNEQEEILFFKKWKPKLHAELMFQRESYFLQKKILVESVDKVLECKQQIGRINHHF